MLFRLKEYLDWMATPLYTIRGSRPWSPGYYTAKKNAICRAIDSGLLDGPAGPPPGFARGIDERSIEYPWVFAQLPARPGKVLDAGSALNHRFLLDRSPLKEAELTVMTLAPEKRCFWSRGISYVYGDLRRTDFARETFDVVVSVSTIEHIGLDNTLLYTSDTSKRESDEMGFLPAVREFRRILKPGGTCLVTVPFGRRGVHGWFQVFDAALVERVVEGFAPTEHAVDYYGYRADGWRRAEPAELAYAEFFDVHTTTSENPDNAAGARGVACLRLVA